ncbi:hypothetical protein V0288_05205, partial [Pannus brasiliensis CCIBt3594]
MKLTARVSTLLKSHPIDSRSSPLPPGFEKVPLAAGESIDIERADEVRNGHYEVVLKTPVRNRSIWYAFKDHIALYGTLVTARFTMRLVRSLSLLEGEFTLSGHLTGNKTYTATSGAPGWQYPGAWKERGRGPIPPATDWKIDLPGYHLDTKGIEGWFF